MDIVRDVTPYVTGIRGGTGNHHLLTHGVYLGMAAKQQLVLMF
jgi:hypothetical protein